MIELAENDLGGCKLASAAISGSGAVYGQLKFESGIHRVQRVPVTESGACWQLAGDGGEDGGGKGGSSRSPCAAAAGPEDLPAWGARAMMGRCISQTASVCLCPFFLPPLAPCRRACAHQRGLGGGAAPG